MVATPGDIAKYTRDGETVTYQDPVFKAANPQARDLGEIATFLRYPADAQAVLNEKSAATGPGSDLHETVEVEQSLGIGNDVPVTPTVPTFTFIDDTRSINRLARALASTFDMSNGDRYSVEVV